LNIEKYTVFLCLLFTSTLVVAQTEDIDVQTFLDSNVTKNFINTNFSDDQLSAALTSRVNYQVPVDRFDFFVKNYYSSAITKLQSNLLRDLDNFKTGVQYDLKNGFSLSANYLGKYFSDDKSIQFSGTSSSRFFGGANYEGNISDASLYSEVEGGYKLEDQMNERNRGVSLSSDFDINNLNIKEYFVDGQLKMGYEDLNPRVNDWVISRLHIDKSFSDNLARNEFDGSYSTMRRDFYFSADQLTMQQYGVENNIEQRIENVFKLFERFDYTINQNLDFYMTVNPYYRSITETNSYVPVTSTSEPTIYDTQVQESTLGGEAALKFSSEKLDMQVKATYTERDEKHLLIDPGRIQGIFVNSVSALEATKDNHSTLFKLLGSGYYNVSLENRFELIGSASIFRYDTPSQQNYDDRDELNFVVYFAHRYNNLKNLIITNSVDVNLYHTVYILAEKSANNNWNRVIRFTSKSAYSPSSWFTNIGVFSVLANYTVYDFQDVLNSVKSYSFRQLNLKDSVITKFSRYVGADVYGEVKLYERGELNWSEFAVKPENYYEDKIINAELNYFFDKFMVVSAGYKFFEQTQFDYINGEKEFANFVKTLGPFVKLSFRWKQNSVIEFVGSYDMYRYSDNTPGTANPNLYINSVLNF